MTNLFDKWRTGPADSEIGDSALEATLGDAFTVRPSDRMTWQAALTSAPRESSVRALPVRKPARRRMSFGIAAAAAVVAAIAVVLPLADGGGTKSVSAQEIIDRSIAAVGGEGSALGSYHMVVEQRLGGQVYVNETWADGNRRRSETRSQGVVFGQSTDGESFWIYTTDANGTRAVRGPTSLAEGRFGADLSGQSSFEEVVANILIPGCQSPSLAGESSLLGRNVYVVNITVTGQSCSDGGHPVTDGKGKQLNQTAVAWFEAETFMLLKLERTDLDTGEVMSTIVTSFDPGFSGPDSTFVYEAPAGVIVAEASDYSEMKHALAPGESSTGVAPGPVSTIDVAETPKEKR